MNKYEELMFKSESARLNAQRCETNWGWQYWNKVADKLQEKALSLSLEEIAQ